MKYTLLLFLLVISTLNVHAQQVEINAPVYFNGTSAADRRIINLGAPIQPTDAANAQAVQSGKLCFAAANGSNNAFSLTLTPAPTQYVAGMVIYFRAPATITGSTTLNLNALGAKALLKISGAALAASEILSGQIVGAAYDGNNFQLLTSVSGLVLSQNGVDYDGFKYKEGFQNFSGPTTWTVPANVTSIMVEVWGAGGGGGSAGCSPCSSYPAGGFGGGGGAGGYGRELLAVTPGTSFTITVGAGGPGISVYTCGQSGGAGSTTSFGSLVSATGGQGGGAGQFRPSSNCSGGAATGAAGLGGTSSASINLTGAAGANSLGGTSLTGVINPPTVPLYLQGYVGTFRSFNPIKPAPGANGNYPNPSPGNTYPQADGQPGFVLISY